MQQVKMTNNYDRFDFDPSNRDISIPKVKQLELSIGLIDFGNSYPIVVGQPKANGEGPMKMTIFDGQHRYWARFQLDKPIWFIIDPKMSIENVGIVNSTQHGWKLADFIKTYSTDTENKEGLHQYKIVAGYRDRHGFKSGVALKILCGGRWGTVKNDLTAGTLTVTANLSEAEQFAKAIGDFGNYVKFNKQDRFIFGFKRLWDSSEYDHKKMLSKLEYLSPRLNRCPGIDDYIKMFLDIYNHKNQNPLTVG